MKSREMRRASAFVPPAKGDRGPYCPNISSRTGLIAGQSGARTCAPPAVVNPWAISRVITRASIPVGPARRTANPSLGHIQIGTSLSSDDSRTGTATTSITFTDFGMTLPRVGPVLSTEDKVTLELDFLLRPSSG